MPVSKRDKKVSLTKVQKKGMKLKTEVVENIRKYLDKYDNVFLFTVNNQRNGLLKDLREEWTGSGRFFLAKRKVMAIALGRNEAEEVQKNLHKLSMMMMGQCGLLLTNKSKDEVVKYFQDYSKLDFARSGFVATETVQLPAGPLSEFAFSLEPHLRQLGLPTKLEKGQVVLRQDYTICTEGAPLTADQANILKLLGKQMAEFKLHLICLWSKDGTFQKLKGHAKLMSKSPKQISTPKEKTPKQKEIKTKKMTESSKKEELDNSTPKTPKVTPKVSKAMSKSFTPVEAVETETPKPMEVDQSNESEIEIPKKFEKSPKQIVKGTPKQETTTPKQDEIKTEKITGSSIKEELADDKSKTPKQTPKAVSKSFTPVEAIKAETPKPMETDDNSDESEIEIPKELVEKSPKVGKGTLRRSMRTPKPIKKRTPEQRRLSVKKLTVGASKLNTPKQLKGTPKQLKGTPKQASAKITKKVLNNSEDVE